MVGSTSGAGVGPSPGQAMAGGSTESVASNPEDLTLQLARAEAERDAAVAALDRRGRRSRRLVKARRGLVGVLVVLFSILLPVTYVVTWAHRVALNTDTFVATVGPAGSDPAVTAAAGAAITDQIFASLNPQQIVANALPPKASFLAGPITNGAKGYVQDGVTKALQTRQFQALWTQALRFAHSQLLSVLNGNSKAVTTTNGQVVLNLVPLFNAGLQNLQGFVSGVVGKPVTLPPISGNELPATVCQRIATALNRPVPATCGQIPLFPADKLSEARRTVRIFNRVTVLLLILTPVIAALALWLSQRRRRTLLQLSAGGLLGLVVVRRVVDWLSSTLVNTGPPADKAARHAILVHLFHAYFSISRWLLVGLVIVFVAAWVTGPYPWARSLRRLVSRYARDGWNLVVAVGGRARDDATIAWVRSHLDLLRVLGVAAAVLLLLILSVSWIGFLILAVLLAAYELWLHRIGQSAPASEPTTSGGTTPTGTPDANPPAPSPTGPAQAV
ncbi:MAG TPA: hypothetical protein VLX59_12685 [Acidimicrobiales bacterium]|nr:hypothetical protein [Acidimicrobiales bacterium]